MENFVLEPEDEENCGCPICQTILSSPLLVSCCGQTFCQACIKSWVESKNTCPLCCTSIAISNLTRNRTLEKMLDKLKGSCENCSWKGYKEDYAKHECKKDNPSNNSPQEDPPILNKIEVGIQSLKVESPPTIELPYEPLGGLMTPYHPHKVKLYPKPPYILGFGRCDKCNVSFSGPVYHCDTCKKYDLCVGCVNHHHQPEYFAKTPYPTRLYQCDQCKSTQFGEVYHCKGCGNYDLCKSCYDQSQLPQEYQPLGGLMTPYHPHKVKLYPKPPYLLGFCRCDKCNASVFGPVYHCDICKKYDLCVGCVNHHHQPEYFAKTPYSTGFYQCDQCKASGSEEVYHCKGCGNYDLCKSCHNQSQLPQPNIANHRHQPEYHANAPYPGGLYQCDKCNAPGSGPVYHCKGCGNYDLCNKCFRVPRDIGRDFGSVAR